MAEMAAEIFYETQVNLFLPRLVGYDPVLGYQVVFILFVHIAESFLLLWIAHVPRLHIVELCLPAAQNPILITPRLNDLPTWALQIHMPIHIKPISLQKQPAPISALELQILDHFKHICIYRDVFAVW